MQGGRTVRSVVGYFVHAFEQAQKQPLSSGKGFSELGPGSLEGQPVLLSLGVGRTLREERCTAGA